MKTRSHPKWMLSRMRLTSDDICFDWVVWPACPDVSPSAFTWLACVDRSETVSYICDVERSKISGHIRASSTSIMTIRSRG